jgi:hypothetical protein
VSPVKYKLGLYIPEDDILHNHLSEHLKSYMSALLFVITMMFVSMLSAGTCMHIGPANVPTPSVFCVQCQLPIPFTAVC